jgi:hypothetical protein
MSFPVAVRRPSRRRHHRKTKKIPFSKKTPFSKTLFHLDFDFKTSFFEKVYENLYI